MADEQREVELWKPVLLHTPTSIRRARRDWKPTLVRGQLITSFGLLAGFMVLQFLIPARLVIGGMGAVGRPPVAIGLLLAFIWAVSAVRPHQLPPGRQPIRWILGVFLLVQLVGLVVGLDRLPSAAQVSSAYRWLILVVAMSGVALAVTDGIRTRDELDRLLRLLVASTAVMSVVGVLQFFGVVDLTTYIRVPGLNMNQELVGIGARGDLEFARVAGTAAHYIEFGVVLALVLPVALHYALFSPPGRILVWNWCAVVIIALGIPMSISRSAVVTTIVAMGMMAIVWPWRQRYNALVLAVLATAVFHVLNRGVLGTIKALFTNVENDPSVQDRIERTAIVMDMWDRRPIFGWGAGMVTPEEFLLLDNQFYVFLLAGGVIAVLAFVLLFFVPYLLGRSVRLRGRDQETRHLGHALAVTMPAAIVASGTFDSFYFTTFVGVMYVLIGAMGALWRLDGTAWTRPLVVSDPGDRLVATPLFADVRARLLRAWRATAPPAGPRGRG
ncbi:O-antigen ligase family protein [Janibacter sp. DB-40]|uniref:O-antigen ligase family protein n=1 Tax=Janibacter sp. DB-40 TaxID=3028808 RepID=UPI002404A7A1|nr:O-antigen ligase family protein [Janibacter sp. DB-40]